LNASLKRLGVETVDLYQLHASDMHTPVEETLSFLDEAVKAGKIHYIGLSNFTGWQLQLIVSTAKAMGVQVPVTLQPQYSLLSREIEWEVIPAALHNGIGCCRGRRWLAASSPANISAVARRPQTRGRVPKKLSISRFPRSMRTPIATGTRSIPSFASPKRLARRRRK
jgi:hypothetical protein